MRAVFLYTELADYTMACFRKHLQLHPEDEIHVIHYPVNSEAPFQFETTENLFLYTREGMEIEDLWDIYSNTSPEVIFCSGWNDAFYNKFVKAVCKTVPVYLCFDNIFRYTPKQIGGLLIARWMFRGVYAGVWVPGSRQREFAKLLGFKESRIFTGFYSTDTGKFGEMYQHAKAAKLEQFPKRFLCVARYVPQKGLEYLWEAFAELCAEQNTEWELWCAGTGENFEHRLIHNKIIHLGFVQPKDFDKLINQTGVFVLPSMFEPWGVVVNEFAAAGFPLVLSRKVGSSAEFLVEGENGYLFSPGNKKQIKSGLRKMMNASKEECLAMGEASRKIADKYNAVSWSATLTKLGALHKL
ncbi:MAG: glycosyltransferase family 4 protein [Bacteroidetes bacterium]|nr:glycosyltransferase family 4 protein [Bacteroidota bacterium]